MIAPATEQALIPSAARFHIGNRNQRLRIHLSSVSIPLSRSQLHDVPISHLFVQCRYALGLRRAK